VDPIEYLLAERVFEEADASINLPEIRFLLVQIASLFQILLYFF